MNETVINKKILILVTLNLMHHFNASFLLILCLCLCVSYFKKNIFCSTKRESANRSNCYRNCIKTTRKDYLICTFVKSKKKDYFFVRGCLCFIQTIKWFNRNKLVRTIQHGRKPSVVSARNRKETKREHLNPLKNECEKEEKRKGETIDDYAVGDESENKGKNGNKGKNEIKGEKKNIDILNSLDCTENEKKYNSEKKDSIKTDKKSNIKKDEYGLPVELLKAQRLPNKKIKTKYGYRKIKNFNETININYKKKKILSIHEGSLKNKKIFSPDICTRPMMSVVKESLFSILKHLGIFNCYDINVIDIFSGSGNLGIECISRNVKNVYFVDISINSCKTIYENLKLCNLLDCNNLNTKIIRADAIELLQDPYKFNVMEKFDLGFFTPPYEQVIYSDLIHSISKSKLFQNDSLIYIEYPKEIELLPVQINNLMGLRNRKFGRTYFALYVLNNTGKYIAEKREQEFYPLHYNRKQLRQHKFL